MYKEWHMLYFFLSLKDDNMILKRSYFTLLMRNYNIKSIWIFKAQRKLVYETISIVDFVRIYRIIAKLIIETHNIENETIAK